MTKKNVAQFGFLRLIIRGASLRISISHLNNMKYIFLDFGIL